jgi:nitroreductase
MDVKQAIETRRAYRSLAPLEVTPKLLADLAQAARLAPSCFNNQPWRFVAVYELPQLDQLKEKGLSRGNAWAKEASLIIAVCSQKELDCIIKDREYSLFDTGIATAHLVLRATELGLIAHPIAGYKPVKVREVLGIPQDVTVIALVVVGKPGDLSEEKERPERLEPAQFFFHNAWVKKS